MRPSLLGARSAVMPATLFALMLFVSACSIATRTVDVAKLGPSNQVQIYEGGKPVVDRRVTPGSADERAVTSWLRAHADGWQSSLVTFAPGRCVRGEKFDLNFGKDRCVLDYRVNDKGDWVQVTRPINNGDPIPNVFVLEEPRR
jgi:hypothetical protein